MADEPGQRRAVDPSASGDVAGDDACWLEQVCDECGGFIDDPTVHVCRQPASVPDSTPEHPRTD